MLKGEHKFKKSTQSGVISDYLVENGFFFLVQRSYSLSQDNKGVENVPAFFLKKLHDELLKKSIYTLSDFQNGIDDSIATSFSGNKIDGVFVMVRGDHAYLITVGNGYIFLLRGKECALIISGFNCAGGRAQDKDVFVCSFNHVLSAEEIQKKLSSHEEEDNLSQFDDTESVLLIQLSDEKNEKTHVSNDTIEHKEKKSYSFEQKNKKYTFIAVAVLVVILIWSVGFGVKRRMDQTFKKEISEYMLKITHSLQRAQEIGAQNNTEALFLINKAKKDLETFKGIVGTRKIPNIQKLSTQISDAEGNIMKKEEKQYNEFYDLNLIEKNAQGDALSVDQDILAVLDKNRGAVYILSLSKKSTDTIKKNEIREASLISFYKSTLFIFTHNNGLYTIDKEKKLTRSIDKDDEWGRIVSFSVYNGNIYLLDRDKNDVYKYLVTENGYSSKQTYLKKEQTVRFQNANSIAIDSSVYIGGDNTVYKYTSGLMDGFSIKIPGDVIPTFNQLFTDSTVKKVYLLDKEQGKIFLFSKQGSFEKQIESSILKQTTSFIVREKNSDSSDTPSGIFVLVKNKIYTISLDPDLIGVE